MAGRYIYNRFRWWDPANLFKIKEELIEEGFIAEERKMPRSDEEFSLVKDFRDHLRIRSDTLGGFLNPYTATLFQKEKALFTERDLRLREIILELYPRNSPTIFPWSYSHEPDFEKEREKT
jgi:hypothetical protein